MLKKNLFILFLFLPFLSFSQTRLTAGGFTLKHYGVKSFGMHPRNFCIAQDAQELLYFGNAYGILQFDGETWNAFNLPNGNSGLALYPASNGVLYAAGFNEVGQMMPTANANLQFESLNNRLPERLRFNRDFLYITEYEQHILFHCELGIHLYDGKQFHSLEPSKGNLFSYVKKIGPQVYVLEKGKGLQSLHNGQLQLMVNGEALKAKTVKEILPLENEQLLVVESNGLYLFTSSSYTPYSTVANRLLKGQQITHALSLSDHRLLITTYNNGLYLFNEKGDLLKHVSVANGLPDNTINNAMIDGRGGLWLALDNGIAYLEINTPFTFIGTESGIQGMGYAAIRFDNTLYLGTSQGVYYCPLKNDLTQKKFQSLTGIHGQIWDLAVIDQTLLCCQNDGLYQIEQDKIFPIKGSFDDEGHWKIVPLINHPHYAIKGTYLGFQLYHLTNGRWEFVRKLQGFEESCRIFEQDTDGTLWMCHGNKGLYSIRLSDDLSRIQSVENKSLINGFAPDYFNDVANINGRLVFAADDGIYRTDAKTRKLIRDVALEQMVHPHRFISRIRQYDNKDIWLFDWEDITLYKHLPDHTYQPVENVFRKIAGELVGSYELAVPISDNLAIIGSQEGFIFFNLQGKTKKEKSYNVLVRKAEIPLSKDSLVYGGAKEKILIQLPYQFRSLRISYAAIFYENHERIVYQYALTSNDQKQIPWTGWTKNTQVDFSNLPEGKYVFHVRAKNIYEYISEEETFTFTVLPPWYRTWWAYTIQGVILVIALFLTLQYILYRFKKQKEKLDREKETELQLLEQKHFSDNLQREKELVELRNAKLESDMVLKNSELASLATTVTQKTEFLAQLKDKLENIQKESDKTSPIIFKEVIKTIDQDLDFDDNWTKFQVHFDELHHHFLHRLREKYPKLNPSWLLLCAYIRMNKSNKEIAALMNISVAAVEKRKYRLREKLELAEDDRLSDFIISF